MNGNSVKLITCLAALLFLIVTGCESQQKARETAQAEEYFTIGMAYFELGRYADAEVWLNRARAVDKTLIASEYNLGRIAYETGRFTVAAEYFENVLAQDPDNIMALQATAFMRIRSGDLKRAEELYDRVLEILPESVDNGFNYALVLYGLEKYEESEKVLAKYPDALKENPSAILLTARAQRAQNKVEAIDSYAGWLEIYTGDPNPQIFYEYAQVLEKAEHYARALDQYDHAIEALTKDTASLTMANLRFKKARILLAVDPENEEGIDGFFFAIDNGFSDTEAIEELLSDERVTSDNKEEIRNALYDIYNKQRNTTEQSTGT